MKVRNVIGHGFFQVNHDVWKKSKRKLLQVFDLGERRKAH